MTEYDFDSYWMLHREQILQESEEYRRVADSYKMKSGADWLLFGIPFFAGILFMNVCNFRSELLKWLLSALLTVTLFVLCVWVKSMLSGERSLTDIEEEVKALAKKEWENNNSL